VATNTLYTIYMKTARFDVSEAEHGQYYADSGVRAVTEAQSLILQIQTEQTYADEVQSPKSNTTTFTMHITRY
jgi:hypothetical protein